MADIMEAEWLDRQNAVSQAYKAHLQKGNILRFRALGGSMWPAIRSGDLVFIAPEHDYEPGDIVLVEKGGQWLLHRLLRIVGSPDEDWLILKGDALDTADQPCPPSAVLGVAYGLEREGRSLDLNQGYFRIWRTLAMRPRIYCGVRSAVFHALSLGKWLIKFWPR